MIQDVGNVELFELFETGPETQCKECLSYWSGVDLVVVLRIQRKSTKEDACKDL